MADEPSEQEALTAARSEAAAWRLAAVEAQDRETRSLAELAAARAELAAMRQTLAELHEAASFADLQSRAMEEEAGRAAAREQEALGRASGAVAAAGLEGALERAQAARDEAERRAFGLETLLAAAAPDAAFDRGAAAMRAAILALFDSFPNPSLRNQIVGRITTEIRISDPMSPSAISS